MLSTLSFCFLLLHLPLISSVPLRTLVSQAIAEMVTEENLAEGRLYPPLSNIREVSFKIAVKVKRMLPPKTPKPPLHRVHIDSLQSGNIRRLFVSHPFPPASSPRSASGVLGGELRIQTQHRLDLPRAQGQGGLRVVSHLQPRLRLLHPGLLQMARGGHEHAGRVRDTPRLP